jgi:predicted RNA-binding protein with PIN domain
VTFKVFLAPYSHVRVIEGVKFIDAVAGVTTPQRQHKTYGVIRIVFTAYHNKAQQQVEKYRYLNSFWKVSSEIHQPTDDDVVSWQQSSS